MICLNTSDGFSVSVSFFNCFILFLFVCPAAHPRPPFAGDRCRRPRLSQFCRPRGKPTRHPRLTQVRLISSGLLVTPRCSCGSALPCLDLPCLESLKTSFAVYVFLDPPSCVHRDTGVTMKTGGFSCGKREFITRSNTQRETKRSFP